MEAIKDLSPNYSKDIEVTKIFKTTDYDKFKLIKGNRKLNSTNYAKLAKSMSEEQLLIPILVNVNYEIIDGQHRFTVQKELKLPVYYYIVDNYSINQVKRANLVSSNWTKEDYLNMHISDGLDDYITFKELYEESKLNISDLLKLYSMAQVKPTTQTSFEFENGSFTAENTEKVKDFLYDLENFEFFKGYKSQSFIAAFIRLYWHSLYDNERLLDKLKTRKNAFENIKSATIDEYLSILCNKVYSFGPGKNNIFYDSTTRRFYS